MEDTNKYELVPLSERKKYYLIDYENVRSGGFVGIEKLTASAKLVIFYTANADAMPFSLFTPLSNTAAEVILCEAKCGGKNALDFQLSSYLGFILGSEPYADCHIISGDKGFEFVRSFWKERGKKVKLSVDIAGTPIPSQPAKPKPTPVTVQVVQPMMTELEKAISSLTNNAQQKAAIYQLVKECKTVKIEKRLGWLNQYIGKRFGPKNQKAYYKVLKPFIQ